MEVSKRRIIMEPKIVWQKNNTRIIKEHAQMPFGIRGHNFSHIFVIEYRNTDAYGNPFYERRFEIKPSDENPKDIVIWSMLSDYAEQIKKGRD
jgi:hypothetical protein